jgi:hypothetical protein
MCGSAVSVSWVGGTVRQAPPMHEVGMVVWVAGRWEGLHSGVGE